MKGFIIPALIGVSFLFTACDGAKRVSDLEGEKSEASYAIGYSMGQNFHQQKLEVDLDSLVTGLMDGLEKKDPLLDDEKRQQALMNLQMSLRKKAEERMKVESEKNQATQDVFLAEYEKKEGVKKAESGLLYKVLTAGTGAQPSKKNTVKVHYKGTLADGTEFDSSYTRGQPAEFGVTQVIPGWSEAIQMMKTGAKWEVVIPSALAYGSRGAGPKIPPNSALVFTIELLEIK